MKKWIAVLLLIIIAIIAYLYVYQDHRDIGNENPEFALAANTIKKEFEQDFIASEKKYLNKTVLITGNVSDSDGKTITLNSVIFCQLMDSITTILEKDSKIKIKGRVIGYDDLLEQVKLDQCTIIN